MALIVLIIMVVLIVAAIKWRDRRPLFAATLGFLTFMIVPLYLWGNIPLKTQVIIALIWGWRGALISAALAIIVYGGTGLLVEAYVRTSRDIRRIRVIFSMLMGAIASAMVYNVLMRFFAPSVRLTYGGWAHVLGVGALVALVVSFAMTHERPAGCSFFRSRDGGTVFAAILGAAMVIGGLNIVVQQVPAPYPMRQMVINLLVGGLLGAGLTIPLRAVRANRLVGAALGAVIGGMVLANVSGVGAAPFQGFLAGAVVGALLPEETCENATVEQQPTTRD